MDDCGNSQTHSPKRLRRERRKTVSVAVEAESLWDVDEADCFVKLAMSHPEMLNHHEQIVWKLVRENGYLWRGKEDTNGIWQWKTYPEKLISERLRKRTLTWE